jgi:c-di-GMP-binding flagellar brake protein YcgR
MIIDRRFERVPIRVPLFISHKGTLFEKKIGIECRDISGGGLAFTTNRRIPVEADSKIVVGGLGTLPEDAFIEGRVVYSYKDESSGRYTVGVEFTRFVNTTREALVDGIHHWPGPRETADPDR